MNTNAYPEDRDGLVRVVHHIRGRLRLRAPSSVGETLSEALRAAPGVRSVVWSTRTRGLLVLYDPDTTTMHAVLDTVSEHAELEAAAPQPDAIGGAQPPATVARAVVGTMTELDRRVQRSTAGTLRLATLIPTALALWAVSEIVRGRVAPLSWSSALWYAHGLFRDYNPPA